MKLFIFAGQSNAQGYGNYNQLDPVPAWAQNAANGWTGAPTVSSDTQIQYERPSPTVCPFLYIGNDSGLAIDQPTTFGPFLGCNSATASYHAGQASLYGPEMSFMSRWAADNPGVPAAVLKVVLGGSSIADWLMGDMAWWPQAISGAVSALTALGHTVEFAGMAWMQGESGAANVYNYLHPTPGQLYIDYVRTFFAQVRAATSASMPIVVGRISNSMEAPGIINALVASDPRYTSDQYIAATEFVRAQQVTLGSDPGNTWWDNDGLPVLTTDPPQWQYHFTSAGYLAMGERAYAAFAHSVPPPPPLPTSYTGSISVNGSAVAIDASTSLSFVANPDGSLRPVLTTASGLVNRFTPWTLTFNGEQG